MSERRTALVLALVVAGVALAAMLPGALHDAFSQDEVASARIFAQATPSAMLTRVSATEATPPLWFAAGWLVHRLGASAYEIRIVFVLVGAMLAGATVLYARRLVPLWAAAFAGLLVALGYEFVFHGAELRAYELYALFSVAYALLLRAFVDAPTRARGVTLALVVAAGSLTNYFFLLLVCAGVLWLWLSPELRAGRRRASLVLAAGLVPIVVSIPWINGQYGRQRFAWIGPFNGHRVLAAYWLLFARAQPHSGVLHTLVPVVFALLVLGGCVLLARTLDGRLCALLAVVPVAIAAIVWLAGPRIFDVRNMLGAGPFAAVAVAAVIARIRRPFAVVATAAGVALAVVGYVSAERVPPPAYDRVANALVAEGWTPQDPIVLYGNFFAFRSPLEWYLPHRPGLTLAVPRGAACGTVFVVAVRGKGWYRIRRAPGATVRYARKIAIARIPGQTQLGARRWPGSHLVAAARGGPACVRVLPERAIVAHLHS